MDYYNFNPDFEDSLAFLSPAAQRNTRLSNRVLSPDYICAEDVQYMRNRFSFNQNYQRPSSTSLVLRKTNDREIVEQYCNETIRYRPYPYPKISKPIQIPKHRPLIRVTVTPNKNTTTQTKLRKRRSSSRKIQSTASNHENFFKAKNVFLVVTSNKREKVYEIKATGSEYSNGARYAKDEEIPVEQNFQQLISSLNMDKKKKKDKGKGKKDKGKKKEDTTIDDRESATSLMNMMESSVTPNTSLLRECICPPPIDTVSPRKSRVRITGKIGLTEDDRYVLKCAATIDGKPVETNYFQEQNIGRSSPLEWEGQEIREIPRVCIPCPGDKAVFGQREKETKKEIPKISQKDEVVQCNCPQDLIDANRQYENQYRLTYPCPAFMNPCPAFRSVETQCCPQNVNTVCFSNIEKLKIFSSRDEVVQCNCPQDLIVHTKNIGIDADNDKNANSPKNCNSPLVIISVYPKQDSNDKFYDEESTVGEENSRPPPKEKAKGKKDKKDEKGDKKKQGKGSRSPSPAKGKEEKKVEKPKGKGKGKDKGDKDKQAKGNKKGGKKEKPTQEEKKPVSKSPERRPSATQFGISVGRCAECCMGCAGNKSGQDNRHGAAQFSTKRMMNWVSAKSDVSNVAINIDGENEFYDVLFRQGDITTDLQVRKTLKDAKATDKGSLENFFLEPDAHGRPRKRSFSQTYILEQPNADNTETLDQTLPRLNVRDSIEISHRREEKNSCNSMTFPDTASSSSTASYTKLAAVKHFQGDNCDLPNPVERDKEIRELLGVERPRASPSRTYQEFAAKAEMDCKCSIHCFYRRQRKTNVSNIKELRQLCMDDAVIQATDDDDVDYNNDDNNNIDCLVCKDRVIPIAPHHENSPIAYECEVDNCQNKGQRCGKVSILKTDSSSNSDPRRQSNIYTPKKESLRKSSQRRSNSWLPMSSNQPGAARRISRQPNGVDMQCPYDELYDEDMSMECCHDDDEDLESEQASRFERPSQFPSDKKICDPKQPGRSPCGVIVQCPLKTPVNGDTIENDNDDLEEESLEQNPPLHQQLILNRNINIYLQIEQFKKQKPIILSRKQYEKVKRAIACTTTTKCKATCVCKEQSTRISGEIRRRLSRVSGEMRRKSTRLFESLRKSSETETMPEVSNKHVQCECSEDQLKEKKKSYFWGKNKTKPKEISQEPLRFEGRESNARKSKYKEFSPPPSRFQDRVSNNRKSKCITLEPTSWGGRECCTSNVSFVSSNNEAFRVPSHTSVVGENNRTQTSILNSYTEGTKQYYESVRRKSRKSRLSNADKINPEETGEYSVTSCNRKVPEIVTPHFDEEDARKSRRPNTVEEDRDQCEVNQNRIVKQLKKDFQAAPLSKIKTKQSKLDSEDILFYDEGQKKQSNKRRNSKKSKLNNNEKNSKRDSRKKSHRVSGAGDETIAELNNEPRTDSRREKESETLRDRSSQPIYCNPFVKPQDDGGMLSRNTPPPERETADASQGRHNCKRCGRLKKSCGNCGRSNEECLHACYCSYELQEENIKPSIKDIFVNSLSKYKRYASSTEVRYTSVIYANYKHVTFSSANVPNENVVPSVTNLLIKNYNSNSLHTIFKGRCRTPTPNLGTSAYSLYSDYSDATSVGKLGAPQPLQERKPFLRRLMSCLVMRSKTSDVKIDASRPIPKISANSSVDSYHINTSLGAVELSSSIYDTSASFYSNHSIQPIHSKIMKRGFLSSVKGFLTNRKT